jgi:5-methylcytosine-specific restriction endonuclease McrA
MFFSEARRLRVHEHKRSLSARIQQTRTQLQQIAATILKIHDVWPGYPPDWDERRALVRSRDKYRCAECGVGRMLQLHHRRAIREGGTHRLDNLALLCAPCHSDAHGGKELKYKGPHSVDDDSPNAIERKMALVNKAIAEKKDIHFRYRKPDGTITSRTVTPRELRKLSISELQSLIGRFIKIEKEGRLCVFGDCHLRRAKRTFAIDRIYKLRLN